MRTSASPGTARSTSTGTLPVRSCCRASGRKRSMVATSTGVTHSTVLARLQAWLVRRGRGWVIAVPYFWLLLFFLVPFAIVLKIAFSKTRIASPPYQPLLQWVGEKVLQVQLNVGNFMYL